MKSVPRLSQPLRIIIRSTQTKMPSLALQLAVRAVKYYLLALFGFCVACLLAAIFGVSHVIEGLLPSLVEYFWRLAALILTVVAIAIVLESIRQ